MSTSNSAATRSIPEQCLDLILCTSKVKLDACILCSIEIILKRNEVNYAFLSSLEHLFIFVLNFCDLAQTAEIFLFNTLVASVFVVSYTIRLDSHRTHHHVDDSNFRGTETFSPCHFGFIWDTSHLASTRPSNHTARPFPFSILGLAMPTTTQTSTRNRSSSQALPHRRALALNAKRSVMRFWGSWY